MNRCAVGIENDHRLERSRPLLVLALVAALLVPVTGSSAAPTRAADFSDVPESHPFSTEITWLADEGVATGFDDGTFRPTGGVSRAAMAAFLYRLTHQGITDAPACESDPFPDVAVSDPFCGEIDWLSTTGITGGYDDGTFRGGTRVTRQALAAFLQRLGDNASIDPPVCASEAFTDVAVSHPFCGEIAWLVGGGVVEGFEDGSFRGDRVVTRQAMAAFLLRLTELTPGSNQPAAGVQVAEMGVDMDIMAGGPDESSTVMYMGADVPDPGQILVTDTGDSPFYGRVMDTWYDDEFGEMMAATEPVSVQDVIPELDLDLEIDAATGEADISTPAGSPAVRVEPRAGVEFLDEVTASCTGDAGALVEVSTTITPGRFDLSAHWDLFRGPDRVSLVYRPDITIAASAGVSASTSCTLGANLFTANLPPINFTIGVIPVSITHSLGAAVEGEVTISGSATMNAEIRVTGALGVSYDRGRFSSVKDFAATLETAPEIAVAATARLDLPVTYSARLYGMAGFDVTVGPYAELTVNPLVPKWLTLEVGIDGSVAAALEITFAGISYGWTHTLAEGTLWSAEVYYRDDEVPTTTTSTTSTSTTTTTSTTLPPTGFCATVQSEIPIDECDALLDLHDSTDGDHWDFGGGWLASSTPCSWSGITCTAGRVTHLDLGAFGLYGTIPPSLADLDLLQTLSLPFNKLYGTIPESLGVLDELTVLHLYDNRLGGAVPLPVLELTDNVGFSELLLQTNTCFTVPAGWDTVLDSYDPLWDSGCSGQPCDTQTAITARDCGVLLDFYDQTSGPVWTSSAGWYSALSPCTWHGVLCQRGAVSGLDLADNNLTGTLPYMVLSNATTLALDGNNLTGDPFDYVYLPKLTYLGLSDNNFFGSIPDWWAINNLEYLYLNGNNFSGLIPFSASDLAPLIDARFWNNGCFTALDSAAASALSTLDPGWNSGCT